MMNQFEVINGYLCVVDINSWDYFYGFNKIIKLLEK
jgi:hypothetical protein